METLLLTRADVRRLLDPAEVLAHLRNGFLAYSAGRPIPAQRAHSPLPGPETSAMLLFPGLVPSIPAYTVKVHAKFPAAQPAIKGVIHLHDLAEGRLLAIMDSTLITAERTALSAVLAADHLARPDARSVAIIGAGVQGEANLRHLKRIRSLTSASVFDTDPGRAGRFAAQMQAELAMPVVPSPSIAAAVAEADIVVTATWSRSPFLFPGMLKPGAHVTTLGADQPGKCELSADLIQASRFICDDRELALRMGAIGGAGLGPEAIDAELGEVLAGTAPGRSSSEQITVFGGVGLAFQDLCAAWQVYKAARASSTGTPFAFMDDN